MTEESGQPAVEALQQLVALAGEMLVARDSRREVTPFQVITLGCLARSLRDAQAVLLLCEKGLTEQALVLARSIWEAAVNVEYIRRAPEERARLYIEYDAVLRWRTLQKAVDDPQVKYAEDFLEAKRSRQKEFDELKSQYDAVHDRHKRWRSWSGKTLHDMAKELGLEGDYKFVYSWVSEQAHLEVTAIGRQFVERDPQTIHLQFPDYTVPAVTMTGWIAMIMEAYNEAFDLSFTPRLEAIMEAQMKLMAEEGGAR